MRPSLRAMTPKISSTTLPNVAFNRAPAVGPDIIASSSVAMREICQWSGHELIGS